MIELTKVAEFVHDMGPAQFEEAFGFAKPDDSPMIRVVLNGPINSIDMAKMTIIIDGK